MVDIPYENTLTTNSTHQQLSNDDSPFSDGAVLSPSRVEEGSKAYDVRHESAKQIEYQYKRSVNPGIEDRELASGRELNCFAFPFDSEQGKTLFTRNPVPGVAFYVLPLVESQKKLSDILSHIVFVDVHGIMKVIREAGMEWEDISRMYVTDDIHKNVYLKQSDTDWRWASAYYPVSTAFSWLWEDFADWASSCYGGVRVRQDEYDNIHPEYQTKQKLDVDLNDFSGSENEKEKSIEKIIGSVEDLQSQFERREVIWGDHYDIDWHEAHQETVKQEIERILRQAGEADDLMSEDTISFMAELGDKASHELSLQR
jgi:hypothetical protein